MGTTTKKDEPKAAAPAAKAKGVPNSVVIERALGVEITEPPEPNHHYCVYPRKGATVDVDEVMQALREAFPQTGFTYFATR